MRAAPFELRERYQSITAWIDARHCRSVLRFGSATSNSAATNGEITSANNNHAELRPLLAAATPTTIDNITHEKRTVRITLMSPLFVSSLFGRGRMLPSGLANPLLSRFAPREGLVTFRQRFVRRCQWWQIAPAGRITDEQWHRYSPEFCTGLALKYCEAA
jgi:hypothetical protein